MSFLNLLNILNILNFLLNILLSFFRISFVPTKVTFTPCSSLIYRGLADGEEGNSPKTESSTKKTIMKIKPGILILSLLIVTLIACDANKSSESRESESTNQLLLSDRLPSSVNSEEKSTLFDITNKNQGGPTDLGGIISSAAAVLGDGDSARKLIRTAELRFRVKNVAQATVSIEDLALKVDGFIVRTTLQSDIQSTSSIPLSADSLLETTVHTVSSSILLRVPAGKLDTTLKSLTPMIDYLDYRHIKVRDVEMELRANEMRMKRHQTAGKKSSTTTPKNEQFVTIENPLFLGTTTHYTTTSATEQRFQHQIKADEAALANLSLEDQIRYSTVTLDIYERQTFRRAVLADQKNIKAYKPGAGQRIRASLEIGWEVLVSVLEFISKLWGIVLLAALVFTGVWIYQKLFRKKSME